MSLRIRQIVLAAHDLERAVARFEDALSLQVAYRDPGVEKFGLCNAMLPIGDQFVEIVSPIRPDTAAGRHLDRHGDSAYMLILQTDDLDRERARLDKLGIRIVWESTFPEARAVHLHPKDVGGAIVSLDQATPPESWRWAGPDWQRFTTSGRRIVDITVGSPRAGQLAQRWCEVLGRDAPLQRDGAWVLPITDGALKFVANASERIIEFGLESVAEGEAEKVHTMCGTQFALTRARASTS